MLVQLSGANDATEAQRARAEALAAEVKDVSIKMARFEEKAQNYQDQLAKMEQQAQDWVRSHPLVP